VRAAKGPDDGFAQIVGAIREQLSDRVIEPMNIVMLAADRIQDALDDAVARGRVTRTDANDLVSDLVRRGREQTDDVLSNLDELLGKGIDQLEALSRKLEERSAKSRRADSVDRLVQSADKARRAVNRALR
jgi:polyhydroxyalkanoate synthesis regulator phasin